MGGFLSVLGTIASVAGRVFAIGRTVLKIGMPILEAMRPAINEVDEAMDYVEGKIAAGGVEADDFLDRNIDALRKLEDGFGAGEAYLAHARKITTRLIMASQDVTPDTIDPQEAAELAAMIAEFRGLSAETAARMDVALAAMRAVE